MKVVRRIGIVLAIVAGCWLLLFLLSLLNPTKMKPWARAVEVRCQSNLREIQRLSIAYRDGPGSGKYPRSEGGAVASLQVLIDGSREPPKPSLFVCPASDQDEASPAAGGKFRLDADHCSYEVVPWPLSGADLPTCMFAFDRSPLHAGRRNVVYVDGSVEFMKEEAFQAAFARQAHARGWTGPPPAGRAR